MKLSSTESAVTFKTCTPQETANLGALAGAVAHSGAVFILDGNLGAGKTVFAQGVAAGLGIDPAIVRSPTFTILHSYKGRRPLLHFDLYRLENEAELEGIGFEELVDTNGGVTVVEWGERFLQAMPTDALWVRLEAPQPLAGERIISMQASGPEAQSVLEKLVSAMPSPSGEGGQL